MIGGGRLRFICVVQVDKDRAAACGTSSLDVARSIAHHDTSRQIDPKSPGRTKKHTCLWFTTATAVQLRMRAELDTIYRKRILKLAMHAFDSIATDEPVANIGLIGHDYKKIPRRF